MSDAAAGHRAAVGQVWADTNRRSAGRTFRVLALDGQHAVVEILSNANKWADWGNDRIGKQTRVLLKRFRPTATRYRLVRERDDEKDEQ